VFVRPGELRGAQWDEFDLDAADWRTLGERMKMRAPHIVPLSHQAVAVLRELHALTGRNKLEFQSPNVPRKPISENTLNYALRRMGFTADEMTAHGCPQNARHGVRRALIHTLLHAQTSHCAQSAQLRTRAHAMPAGRRRVVPPTQARRGYLTTPAATGRPAIAALL